MKHLIEFKWLLPPPQVFALKKFSHFAPGVGNKDSPIQERTWKSYTKDTKSKIVVALRVERGVGISLKSQERFYLLSVAKIRNC